MGLSITVSLYFNPNMTIERLPTNKFGRWGALKAGELAWRPIFSESCVPPKQLDPPDEDLAKVRFAHSVFEVLKAKRRKGETVRQALERIILEASSR